MKKLFCLMFTVMMLLSAVACNVSSYGVTSADTTTTEPPAVTVSPDELVVPAANPTETVNVDVEDTATPEETAEVTTEPEPTPEPVITYSDYRLVPFAGEELPEHYFCVTDENYPFTLCVFIDEDGVSQWRIFAEQDVFADGELSETINGFLKCHVNSAVIRLEGEPSYKFEAFGDLGFVNYDEEKFGVATLYTYDESKGESAPYTNVLYATYDDVNDETKTEEPKYSYMYPVVDGNVAAGAVPVVVDDDLNFWYIVPGGDKVLVGTCETPVLDQ